MYCGDEVAALVGDIGSSFSKFGYAGEDTPRHICTSNVGVDVRKRVWAGDEAAGYLSGESGDSKSYIIGMMWIK